MMRLAAVLFLFTSGAGDREASEFAGLLETRPARVAIELTSPEAAGRATIRPLPLYGGAEWAITSRWDDNTVADLKMRDVLLAHGHRGTFFLNDPARNFYGKTYGLLGNHERRELGRLLVGRGITVGGHSLTHPMLSYQNRNRIFEELLGSRIVLEAAYDTLVNAYAFSFCNFRNPIEGDRIEHDIGVMLARAGYLQVANHRFGQNGRWPLGTAGLLPPDGRPIDEAFARFLADRQMHQRNPAITYSMHTWYDTPEAWAGFEDDLDRYGRRPSWWYANHNEYGAYRVQYQNAAQGRLTRAGNTVTFVFQRPVLVDLNDPVPLTFEVAGVGPADLVSLESSTGRVERIDSSGGSVRFHLHHPPGQRLPQRIDHIETDDGKPAASAEFSSITGSLALDSDSLRLCIQNQGPRALKDVRIVYRMPLMNRDGYIGRERFDLASGAVHRDVLPLDDLGDETRYHAGVYYAAAQIDFSCDAVPARLYFTTHGRPKGEADPSYPQGGFSILGPIPRDAIDLDSMPPSRVEEIADQGWMLADGRRLSFEPVDLELTGRFNVEVIPVRGRWDNQDLLPSVYLLVSTVTSPVRREVQVRHVPETVPAIWINGKPAGGTAVLESGDNGLMLAYEPPVLARFSPEHAGPAIRIVEAGSGERASDVVYRPIAASK